ncbi:MAG: hypothetical protein QOE16_271 [Microbacteriaceae bacterium]|jgi:uncharacterized membrane protein|nr:hypothetical protein [Microbacteriaceae bacterium]
MQILFNVLHIVAAVFIVGPMAILPMTAMRALRAGNGAQVATLAKSSYVFSLLSLLVAVLGFGALGVSDPKDHFSFTSPWILISIILYVVAVGLSLFLVVPAMRRAAEQLESATQLASAAQPGTPATTTDAAGAATSATGESTSSGYGAIAGGSGVVALLLVAVVVLMVWKP